MAQEDKLGVVLSVISFLIPIVGWVLWFVYKDNRPDSASSAATLAWIGFFVNLIIVALAG